MMEQQSETKVDGSRPGLQTLGITSVVYSTTIRSNVQIRRDGLGPWCSYPVNSIVEHGFSRPITIYIAREFAEGTCKYVTTMEHEMRHVSIHEAGLWQGRLAVDREMAAAVRRAMPITGQTKEEVTKAVDAVISDAVDRAISEVSQSIESDNAAMDTTEAYIAFSGQCPD